MSDIALTAAQRGSLLSLQNTQTLSERTQTRLSTGRKVNSVVDDAVNFFKAKGLNDRAADFNLKKDGIGQGISTLNSALGAIEGIDSLLKQMKGIAEAAKSQTDSERVSATTQFIEIGDQISQLIEDASYQGLNLLNSTNSTLDVSFGIRTASKLQVQGLDLNSSNAGGLGMFSVAAYSSGGDFAISNFGLQTAAGTTGGFSALGTNNSNTSLADTAISILDGAVSTLRGQAATLGSNVAILQTRLDFTTAYTNELTVGSDKLTLADLNEEGANLVALQTRQQLGIQSLAISGQQQQAVLSLIG